MNPTPHLVAALAGAAVTVAVYQGVAIVRPVDGTAVQLAAGEARTFGPATATTGGPTVRRVVVARDPSAAPPPPASDPQERIAQLEEQVAALEFEAGLLRGQLAQQAGDPSPWPEQVPAAWEPEAYEAALKAALEQTGIGDLLTIDCAEFPCIAFVDVTAPADEVQAKMDAFGKAVSPPDGNVMQLGHRAEDDDGTAHHLLATAVLPENADPNVMTRTEFRARTAVEDLAQEDAPPAP